LGNVPNTDATDRANHTGTQLAATISDFDTAVTGSTHAGRVDNPHAVTKAQVGLDLVPNVDATARSTHTGTQLAVTISDFDTAVTGSTHAGLTDNPHAVTATQVGLGNVPNVDATARATHTGTQLAATISDFDTAVTGSTHAGRVDNPHAVTATQVGLANVPNVDATARATHTGTQLAATISDFDTAVTGSTHAGLTDNPHSVTATQVGLGNVPNTDATDRANHTGTQLAATISDLTSTVKAIAFTGTSAVAAANNGVVPDDGTLGTGTRFLRDNGTWGNASDSGAIHKAVANEIAQIAVKAVLNAADPILIEDSEAANAKASTTVEAVQTANKGFFEKVITQTIADGGWTTITSFGGTFTPQVDGVYAFRTFGTVKASGNNTEGGIRGTITGGAYSADNFFQLKNGTGLSGIIELPDNTIRYPHSHEVGLTLAAGVAYTIGAEGRGLGNNVDIAFVSMIIEQING
jgi:hypothetical protein